MAAMFIMKTASAKSLSPAVLPNAYIQSWMQQALRTSRPYIVSGTSLPLTSSSEPQPLQCFALTSSVAAQNSPGA
jgi:hypothetical protein